jgi:hypothetical protein
VNISPGLISGNAVQVPVHIPINVCGNTISVIGLLNPAFGNTCNNGGTRQRQLPTLFTVIGSYSPAITAYVFQVPHGVVLDICGVKEGFNGEDTLEILCNTGDSVTIG